MRPMKIDPVVINAITEDGQCAEIKFSVDSGATETVMSEDTLTGVIDITDSAAC